MVMNGTANGDFIPVGFLPAALPGTLPTPPVAGVPEVQILFPEETGVLAFTQAELTREFNATTGLVYSDEQSVISQRYGKFLPLLVIGIVLYFVFR